MSHWKVPAEVEAILEQVKEQHHHPRLQLASVVACFDESKPFQKNKINLGRVSKFNAINRLFHGNPHDFCVVIPVEIWTSVLKADQKAAYLDLQLTRCEVEYEPETYEENGKKKPVKDEFNRVKYTDKVKTDPKTGEPKWKVAALDFNVLIKNVKRHGLWLEEWVELRDAIRGSN